MSDGHEKTENFTEGLDEAQLEAFRQFAELSEMAYAIAYHGWKFDTFDLRLGNLPTPDVLTVTFKREP